MKAISKLLMWAMMFMAITITTTALTACSDDDPENETMPAETKAQMYGRYNGFTHFGGKLTASVTDVWVSEDHITYTLPMDLILPYAMTAEQGLAEALETVKADKAQESYTLVRYFKNVASFTIPTQTVKFTYTVNGAKKSGSIKLTTQSFAYNASTMKLNVAYTLDAVTLGGKEVSGLKKKTVRMADSARKD